MLSLVPQKHKSNLIYGFEVFMTSFSQLLWFVGPSEMRQVGYYLFFYFFGGTTMGFQNDLAVYVSQKSYVLFIGVRTRSQFFGGVRTRSDTFGPIRTRKKVIIFGVRTRTRTHQKAYPFETRSKPIQNPFRSRSEPVREGNNLLPFDPNLECQKLVIWGWFPSPDARDFASPMAQRCEILWANNCPWWSIIAFC